ncbi:MAG TPA: sugar ABC transporter substrate-binding protein [Fimbriimonadaceae bacterium]|nr:sugar ABC transporter substrate-binding protein [Fimbriimonadaceae bacterium]
MRALRTILALTLLGLLGCGDNAPAKPVLRVANWGGAGEDNEFDRLVQKFNARFEQEHGVDLRIEGIPGEYVHKMLLNFIAGTQPDVMVLDASSAAVFINNGLLTDLRPFIESDPQFDLTAYYPNVVEIAKRGDAIYAIPGDFTPMVMYFNKDLFDAAGVPYPKPGWSFEDFLETARKLTVRDGRGRVTQYGFAFTNWMPGWVMWLWNNGGEVLSPDGTKAEGFFDSPQNVEAVSFLRELVNVHRVAPSLSEQSAMGVDLFANGQAAMVVMGHWALVGYKAAPRDERGRPKIDWQRLGVVELPHNTPEPHTVMYEAGFAIPRGCKNPELAWEYIKLWTSRELQYQYSQSGIAVSARIDVSRKRAEDPIEAQFLPIIPQARPPLGSRVEGYEVVEKHGKNALDSILNNAVPVQQALTRAARRIDQEFAKRL